MTDTRASGSYPRRGAILADRMMEALNRVCRWRRVFTGKMLGTNVDSDPHTVGMNELQEARIIMRVELTALAGLMLRKGLITQDEFTAAIEAEANQLNEDYEKRFPGFKATDDGMRMDMPLAAETMKSQPWAK